MKKWSQFLAESQEEVLQEFNKKDLEAVMKDGDRFTVSFEIELEADAEQEDDYGDYYGDDYYEAREEARNEAAREYFNNNAEDYLRGEIRENGYLEDHWDETPSDGEEIFEWFAEDRGFSPNKDNIVRIAVDVGAGDSDFANKLIEIIKGGGKAKEFVRQLINNNLSEVIQVLGWDEKQLTFDFETEGGKSQLPDNVVDTIVKSRKAMAALLSHFVINAAKLQTNEVFPKSKNPYPIATFVEKILGQSFEDYSDAAVEYMGDKWEDLADSGAIDYETIDSNFAGLPFMKANTWASFIFKALLDSAENAIEEKVEQKAEEFNEAPADHLEEMGYEEYQYFNEDVWREEWEMENRRTRNDEYSCDVDSLEEALEEYFPNFMAKYAPNLKFEKDPSLTCGIEFSSDNPPYITGFDAALEYLNDFFDEYEKQDFFTFDDTTGLHTNIGMLTEEGAEVDRYNFFKALMFLNHTFATTGVGFPSREYSRWTGDLKKPALENIANYIKDYSGQGRSAESKKDFIKDYLKDNFEELEDLLNANISRTADSIGPKGLGFNIVYTPSRNYIEFRYPGKEDPTPETMKKALEYYAFIIKAATDPTFKRKEYIKDLVGFINSIEGEKPPSSKISFVKNFKKGQPVLINKGSDTAARSILTKIYAMGMAADDGETANIWRYSRFANVGVFNYLDKIDDSLANMLNRGYIAFYDGLSENKKKVKIKAIRYRSDSLTKPFKIMDYELPITQFQEWVNSGIAQPYRKDGRKGKAIAKVAKLFVDNVENPLEMYKAMKPKENSD
jgi:hypothetical protein